MLPELTFNPPEHIGADLSDTVLTLQLLEPTACRVLIVDDDELVRARLTALLRMSRFEVRTAASAQEALKLLSEDRCEILLTDLQMPDMDGLALCRNIRENLKESYIYVLMLSVCATQADILAGLAAGADGYMVKGASTDEILARMEVARRITHVEHSLRSSNRENRRLSVTDTLTGAHNLRYFTKYLPRELQRSQRYGHSLAILSCDIDGFKQINDTFGHAAGDEVLQEFVARSQGRIRSASDWLARVGGDEFMIVLPETAARGAHLAAAMLRQTLAAEPVSSRAGPIKFTVSIGVTALEPANEADSVLRMEHLLRAADRGLYADKLLRGNRSRIAADADKGSPRELHGSHDLN